jgi:hypothetical protein
VEVASPLAFHVYSPAAASTLFWISVPSKPDASLSQYKSTAPDGSLKSHRMVYEPFVFSSAASLIRRMKKSVGASNSCGSTRKISSPGLFVEPFCQPVLLGELASTGRRVRSSMSTVTLFRTFEPERLLKMMSSLTFSADSPLTRQTMRAIDPLRMLRGLLGRPNSNVRMR